MYDYKNNTSKTYSHGIISLNQTVVIIYFDVPCELYNSEKFMKQYFGYIKILE